jgi:DNA-binding CsgD family transcriptional regulator
LTGDAGVGLLRKWLTAHSSAKPSFDDPDAAREEFDQIFTYIFNGSLDGISVLDEDFTILGANSALESLYSRKLPLVGRKCYEAYHDRSGPCERCPTAAALASARPQTGIVAYEGGGERRGEQELSVFPVFDDRGRAFGVIEYVRDVSGPSFEKRAAENLNRRIQFQDHSLKEREAVVEYLLRRNGEAERRLAHDVAANVELLINPLLAEIKGRCRDPGLAADLELLGDRLGRIASPFLRTLSAVNRGLSRRELEVASLIREGRSSKDIAGLLRISEKAIDFHRMNLRKKLGILGTGMSLFERLRELDQPPGKT